MAERKTIFVLNGPNLNLLGMREPDIYGQDTLDDIAGLLEDQADGLGFDIEVRQSNHEGHLCDWMHEAAADNAHAIILNAGALTHTSLALYDAIKAIDTPVIEVHISNPAAREEYRAKSYIAPAARGSISGFGVQSYALAMIAASKI